MKQRLPAILLALATMAMTAGCGGAFARDGRVHITSPREDSTVTLPLHLRWDAHGARLADPGAVGPGSLYFAVFVDRRPLGPGQHLTSLIERECAAAGHGCATRAYFERRNVYLTGGTALDIGTVPDLTTHRRDAALHTVTIVLMDHRHQRVGDAAWTRSFRVVEGR